MSLRDEDTSIDYSVIYPNRDFQSLYFTVHRPNPLFIHDIETSTDISVVVQQPDEIVQLIDNMRDHYSSLPVKRKWFTYGSSLAVTISYISGLIVEGNGFDREAVSYNDRVLFMGMVGLWPDCTDNRRQLWRLVTSVFSHSGFAHYGGNIMGLFGLSFLLEMHQDICVILPLVFLGTVHGNLSFFYVKPYSYAVGVSQSVFVLLGLNMANGILNCAAFPRLHTGIIFYISAALLLGEFASYDESNNIAYICHWSSLISGIIGGLGFLKQYNPTPLRRYGSYLMMGLYTMYTAFWFEHYTFEWPPMQSYTNLFEPVDTVNCCYEWFKYKMDNPESVFEDYQCPYTIIYGENAPNVMYKTKV